MEFRARGRDVRGKIRAPAKQAGAETKRDEKEFAGLLYTKSFHTRRRCASCGVPFAEPRHYHRLCMTCWRWLRIYGQIANTRQSLREAQ